MARSSSRFLFRFISNFSRNYAALWVTIVVRPSIRRSFAEYEKICDTTISTLGAGGNATRVANVLYTVLVYSLLSTFDSIPHLSSHDDFTFSLHSIISFIHPRRWWFKLCVHPWNQSWMWFKWYSHSLKASNNRFIACHTGRWRELRWFFVWRDSCLSTAFIIRRKWMSACQQGVNLTDVFSKSGIQYCKLRFFRSLISVPEACPI